MLPRATINIEILYRVDASLTFGSLKRQTKSYNNNNYISILSNSSSEGKRTPSPDELRQASQRYNVTITRQLIAKKDKGGRVRTAGNTEDDGIVFELCQPVVVQHAACTSLSEQK